MTIKIPTMDNLENIKKNKELRKLYVRLAHEKALFEVLSPKIDEVYNTILTKYNFKDDEGNVITNYEKLFLSSDDVSGYYNEANEALKCYGLPDGHCPKLTQRTAIFDVENKILSIVEKEFQFPPIYNLKMRKDLLDLTAKFIF